MITQHDIIFENGDLIPKGSMLCESFEKQITWHDEPSDDELTSLNAAINDIKSMISQTINAQIDRQPHTKDEKFGGFHQMQQNSESLMWDVYISDDGYWMFENASLFDPDPVYDVYFATPNGLHQTDGELTAPPDAIMADEMAADD